MLFFFIKENLHYVTQLEDCPPHVMIRAGVIAGRSLGRYFLYTAFNCALYLEKLRNF